MSQTTVKKHTRFANNSIILLSYNRINPFAVSKCSVIFRNDLWVFFVFNNVFILVNIPVFVDVV